MHASGMRETARALHGSPTTVIKERKKRQIPPDCVANLYHMDIRDCLTA
jgi:hypothetical protein